MKIVLLLKSGLPLHSLSVENKKTHERLVSVCPPIPRDWPGVHPPPEHIGWVWLVKMREGDETAEDAWLTEGDSPRPAIEKARAMYPNAVLVSCHRRDEWMSWSAFRQLLDGRVI